MSPRRDRHAAALLRQLRVDRGLTPEGLSYAIHKVAPGHPVSGRTIRRIESTGHVPTVRAMFGIAAVFGMVPSQIWATAAAPAPRQRVAA
jgi:transcriptional regulator with XRE-family HTH domain